MRILFIILFLFLGCDDDDNPNSPSNSNTESLIIGDWAPTTESQYDENDALLGTVNIDYGDVENVFLRFNSDSTCEYWFDSYTVSDLTGTYSISSNILTFYENEGGVYPHEIVTINSTTLQLKEDIYDEEECLACIESEPEWTCDGLCEHGYYIITYTKI